METWQNFYFLCGSSAASLTGLMFIAVTFGSKLITEKNLDQVHTFLSSICIHFVQAFFLCCVASIPRVDSRVLAAVTICTGAWRLRRTAKIKRILSGQPEVESSDWFYTLYFPTIIQILLVVTGVSFLLERSCALALFAASLISLIMVGALGAWDMLIWTATKMD